MSRTKSENQTARKASSKVSTVKKLKLVVTIVNKNKEEFYMDYLQSFGANLQMMMRASGTAGSEVLHYRGLEKSEKTVLFSLLREDYVPRALAGLEEKFQTIRGGKGIAFSVPLSGVIGSAIYQFLSNQNRGEKGELNDEI